MSVYLLYYASIKSVQLFPISSLDVHTPRINKLIFFKFKTKKINVTIVSMHARLLAYNITD